MSAMAHRTERSDTALLLLRGIMGVLFLTHGVRKLSGLDALAVNLAESGLEPGMFFAVLLGVLEFGVGLLFLVGLLTPLAAVVTVGIMIVAIAAVTGENGFVPLGGVGYEYNLVLVVASLALAIAGPGRLSLDHRLGLDWAAIAGRARRMRQQVASL